VLPLSAPFVIRRVLSSLGVLFGVVVLVFVAVRIAPGDPVTSILGEHALDVDREALIRCMRLDRGTGAQFVGWLGDVGNGTFGRFCDDPDRTVRTEITRVLWPTVQLALTSLLFAIGMALPLGVVAARRPRTWVDTSALVVALLGISIPNFWLGPMLLVAFSLGLAWLPAPGEGALSVASLVLPTVTLGTALAAKLTRMTRATVLDTLPEAFVVAARARGLSERAVVWRHALRAGLTPIVSVLGMQLGALLAGAIVVEKVFARPGLGTLLLDAIQARNYALVQGCVLVIAMGYVIASLLADLAYAAVDPRVRDADRGAP